MSIPSSRNSTVSELCRNPIFSTLELALSEKQTPQVVEKIENAE
jgi:hypothetical protein